MTKWILGMAAGIATLTAPFMLLLFLVPLAGGARAAVQLNPCASPVSGSLLASGTGFRLPLTGRYTITSRYGTRVHPVTGLTRLHAGVDLAMQPHGGAVLSMGAGTVKSTGSGGAGGNIVVVDHGGGLVSKYLHLRSIDVRAGQRVAPGTRVGIEGATGRVTGAHLHWEVWVDGRSVDPIAWAGEQGLVVDGDAPAVSAATEVISAAGQATGSPGSVAGVAEATAADRSAGLPTQIGRWKGEQIVNAGHIIAAGKALDLDAWSLAIGVMTAMGESSLRNVDRGDRVGPDSRGLFQQRANGAWGSYQDRMTPRIAATNFFRALVKVPGYRELAPTIAAHRVQRNANPRHYEHFWPDAVAVVVALEKTPDLLAALPGDAAAASCSDVATGTVPPGPDGGCPATGMSAERGLKPRALRGLRCGIASFPEVRTAHGVGRRPLSASDHPAGYAVDFMIDNYRSAEGRAYGWQLAEWMRANADELGVRYIIFDMKAWHASRPEAGWRPYTTYGPSPDDNKAHRNHVHVSYQRN